jgi:serralysin
VFASAAEISIGTARDRIADFSHAQADVIDLSAIDADGTTGSVNAFTWIGTSAFHHLAGELRYQASGTSTLVQGDIDGNGVADFALLLTGTVALQQSDFVL